MAEEYAHPTPELDLHVRGNFSPIASVNTAERLGEFAAAMLVLVVLAGC